MSISQYWALNLTDLRSEAASRDLVKPHMHINDLIDEKFLVDLLQADDDKFEHQYDKYTLKELKEVAKSLNLRTAVTKAKNIENILKKESPPTNKFSRYNNIKTWEKARLQKAKYDKAASKKPKPNFYYLKGGCRIKKSSRVRELKPAKPAKPVELKPAKPANPPDWRRCDAMKDGRVCRKWQKLHKTEFNNFDLPYRCRKCAKANRDTDPDFKPIGPDGE